MGRNNSLNRVHPFTLGLLLVIGTVVGQAEQRHQTICCQPQNLPHPLDEKAVNLLEETRYRLAAAGTLAFKTVVTDELSNCPAAPLQRTASEVLMARPNKLRVITSSGDTPYTEFYYDGRMITEFSPAANFSTATTAPPTIDGALKAAYNSAGIYFPFADILLTARYNGSTGLESAVYVGQSRAFDGTMTETIAYTTEDVDAQLWIGAQDKLPKMLVVVFRKDPLQLRHQLEFSNWQIDQPVNTAAFNVNNAILAAQEPVLPSGSELPTMNIPATPVR